MRGGVACSLIVALTAAAAPARAQKPDRAAEARRLYDEGLKLYNRASYAEAIEKFKAADALAPSPALAFDIGQAYRHLGDCPSALGWYRLYVQRDPKATERAEVRMAIIDMEACTRVDLVPRPPLPPPPPAPDLDAGKGKKIWGLATAGAGVALVATGVVLALRAHDAENQIDALGASHGAWSPHYADLQSSGSRDATLAKIAIGVGGAALVTGGVLFVVGVREHDRALSGVNVAVSWNY